MADNAQLLDETPAQQEAELDRSLYAKFEVRRADAEAQARHAGCRVFVLDVDDDPHAAGALLAYAQACEEAQPDLAADVRRLVVGHHLSGTSASHPSSRPSLISTATAEHALQLLELMPVDDQLWLTQRYAHTVVEQEKRMSIARQIASAKLADLDGYVHGEECGTYYEGECDCGHEGLVDALRDLVRVLGVERPVPAVPGLVHESRRASLSTTSRPEAPSGPGVGGLDGGLRFGRPRYLRAPLLTATAPMKGTS